MKNAKTIALGMCMLTMVSGFTFTSCATKQGTGTLVGTGAGGALGALVGGLIGHGKGAAIGTAIGAAVGAGAGTLIGRHMDKVAEQAKQVENAKVETVTDANGLKAVKVTFDNGSSAIYNFDDNLRRFNWGTQVGFSWNAYKHFSLFSDLTYSFNNIFKSDFHTVAFTMHPIYLNAGFGYRF